MFKFVGWVPTVTGRLSFSRAGDAKKLWREVANNTATTARNGFLFVSEVRFSRDGPLPALVMARLGRVPAVQYLAFLKTGPAQLPCPASKKRAEDEDQCPVILEADPEGSLSGDVYLFSSGKQLSDSARSKLDAILQHARQSRFVSCSPEDRQRRFREAKDHAQSIWTDLRSLAQSGKPCPAFAKLSVDLLRSGECRVAVDPKEIFTTENIKASHAHKNIDYESRMFREAAAAVARQGFFFIRDLAHNHYHHDPHSDLLTQSYPWEPADDVAWRRETQYGLARLAIAARRRDTAEAYKNALGLVAYAEAFQRHLCGWFQKEDRSLARSSWGFAYDFAALRQSIEASLKIRELRDGQRRQTYIFAFGFVVTCLGLILTGLRAPARSPTEYSLGERSPEFLGFADLIALHPVPSLVIAAVLAWTIDIIFIRFSTRPALLGFWDSGLGRFAVALLGTLVKILRLRWLSSIATAVLLAALGFGLAALAFFVGKVGFQTLSGS